MVQGKELTPEEKQFVHAKKSTMFPRQIAAELSSNPEFTMVNGGHRSPITIKNFLKKEHY